MDFGHVKMRKSRAKESAVAKRMRSEGELRHKNGVLKFHRHTSWDWLLRDESAGWATSFVRDGQDLDHFKPKYELGH